MKGFDSRMMKRALALARKGRRVVRPNPQVGAIIVNQGKIISSAWHQKAGEAHAEVAALNKLTTVPKDSTLYVTLEPCNHTGATPPCAEAIINSGIKRVVIAIGDPNKEVKGGGIEKLSEQGIEVEVGCLEQQARELLKPWIFWLENKKPYFYGLLCFSLDGKVLDLMPLLKENKDLNFYFQRRKGNFDLILDETNFSKLAEDNLQSVLSLSVDLNREYFLKNLLNELIIIHFPLIVGATGKTFLNGLDLKGVKELKLKNTKRYKSFTISRFEKSCIAVSSEI